MLWLSGCGSSVEYYAPYRPTDHQVMLVLIPKGKAETVVSKMLDRLENPPYRIVSIPEEECSYRAETTKLYNLLHRATPAIAKSMAKSVNATLVVFEDNEVKKKSYDQPANTAQQSLGSTTQNFPNQAKQPDDAESADPGHSEDLRIAVYDARIDRVLWHESMSTSASAGAIDAFCHRLVTEGGTVTPSPVK